MAVRFAARALGAAALAAILAKDAVASVDIDAELVEGLASDEVCQGEDAEACGLELRQLRAQERKAAVSRHEHEQKAKGDDEDKEAEGQERQDAEEAEKPEPVVALQVDRSFGPDSKGINMWQEPTWNDVLLEMQSKMNGTGSCNTHTGGSCRFLSCSQSRGPTVCSGHQCQCASGYCMISGACFPMNGVCQSNTGGTCSVRSCSSSRGQTQCTEGTCLCKLGGCAFQGKCFAITDTGASCAVAECPPSLGPTTCYQGRCICQRGYVSVDGKCTSYQE